MVRTSAASDTIDAAIVDRIASAASGPPVSELGTRSKPDALSAAMAKKESAAPRSTHSTGRNQRLDVTFFTTRRPPTSSPYPYAHGPTHVAAAPANGGGSGRSVNSAADLALGRLTSSCPSRSTLDRGRGRQWCRWQTPRLLSAPTEVWVTAGTEIETELLFLPSSALALGTGQRPTRRRVARVRSLRCRFAEGRSSGTFRGACPRFVGAHRVGKGVPPSNSPTQRRRCE